MLYITSSFFNSPQNGGGGLRIWLVRMTPGQPWGFSLEGGRGSNCYHGNQRVIVSAVLENSPAYGLLLWVWSFCSPMSSYPFHTLTVLVTVCCLLVAITYKMWQDRKLLRLWGHVTKSQWSWSYLELMQCVNQHPRWVYKMKAQYSV